MRSVVVVFPASMWAMMPMLRYCSSGVVRGICEAVSYEALCDPGGPSLPGCPLTAKMRLDQTPHTGAGVHPPSPGALAAAARVGTQGASRPLTEAGAPHHAPAA